LKSVVVSVHHNHASGLIKIYQVAGGVFLQYRLFGRLHLGHSIPIFKIWHRIKKINPKNGYVCAIANFYGCGIAVRRINRNTLMTASGRFATKVNGI
jgi:hypothetical protein